MTKFSIESQKFPIKEGSSIDDIADAVRSIMSLPIKLERITIEDEIRAEFWMEDLEPPFGRLPEEANKSYGQVLAKVGTFEINPSSEIEINLGALSEVVRMFLLASEKKKAGLAWLINNSGSFSEWLGIPRAPTRFFELPVIEVKDVPEDKLILLCGRSSRVNPLESDTGIVAFMEKKK